MKIDLYTKIVLTFIALALLVIAIKPLFPQPALAQYGTIDVNIASIYGEVYAYRTYGKLPIRGEIEANVTNPDDIGQSIATYIGQ
jgi:hypothetical protein